MRTFIDNKDTAWNIDLTIDVVKRVRRILGVDLLALESGEPPLLVRLATDVVLLCDIIFCLVKPQADELGISDEEFARRLGPDAVQTAVKCFYEALTDFFRRLGRTETAAALAAQSGMISKATEKGELIVKALAEKAQAMIDGMDPQEVIRKAFGESSISSPDQSGSNRAL